MIHLSSRDAPCQVIYGYTVSTPFLPVSGYESPYPSQDSPLRVLVPFNLSSELLPQCFSYAFPRVSTSISFLPSCLPSLPLPPFFPSFSFPLSSSLFSLTLLKVSLILIKKQTTQTKITKQHTSKPKSILPVLNYQHSSFFFFSWQMSADDKPPRCHHFPYMLGHRLPFNTSSVLPETALSARMLSAGLGPLPGPAAGCFARLPHNAPFTSLEY